MLQVLQHFARLGFLLRVGDPDLGLALPESQGRRFAIRANVGWLPHAPQELVARLGRAADQAGGNST